MLDQCPSVFKSLNSHDVKYIVIGGIAAVVHGVPRMTFDVDLLIDATEDNARRLLDALSEAGLATAALTDTAGILSNEITIFRDFVRVDVLTEAPGIRFDEVWSRKRRVELKTEYMWILSKADLVSAKKASGRPRDLEDVRALESIDEPPPPTTGDAPAEI